MAHNRELIVQRIEECLLRGNGTGAACDHAGIDRATLWRWCKDEPTLKKRLEAAMLARNDMVEDRLFAAAIDGDVKAQIFWLSRRDPTRWGDHERGGYITNVVVGHETAELVSKLSSEQREKMLNLLRMAGLAPNQHKDSTELNLADAVTVEEDAHVSII